MRCILNLLNYGNMAIFCFVALLATITVFTSILASSTVPGLPILPLVFWFCLPVMGWWKSITKKPCINFLLAFKQHNRKLNIISIQSLMVIKVITTIIIIITMSNQLKNSKALKGIYHLFCTHLNQDFTCILELLNLHRS